MAATLTTSDGYLIYTVEGKIHEIPYSLLSICTIVKYTDRVSIILPSETNAHIKSFIDIYPVAGGTITTVDAIEAIIKLAQSEATTGGGATGSSTAIAEYRSPTDFTVTYTSTSTFTLSGYNFQLDSGVQIVYIRQRKVDNTSVVYVNGASGYAFYFDTATNIVTIYKDGVAALVFASTDMYEVGINSSTKGYDITTDSNKSFVNNYPVQPIQLDILDTTNIIAATNYYPSSDGIDMSIHNNFSLSGYILDADGVITMTLEGTNDEDLVTGDWHTMYAYNFMTNAQEVSWAVTNTGLYFALILKDCKFNNIRIKVVNNGATNTMRLKGRLTY